MTEAARVDGRRQRPARNRLAVVDAILDLLDEGVSEPTVEQIAERAGVSVRSVFRYFDDLDALAMAAVERQIERTYHLWLPPSADGPLEQRVDALVAQRHRLFEAIAPVRRHALRRLPARAPIRAGLAQAGRTLRAQVADQFRPEIERVAPADRDVLLDALDAAAGWPTWEHLRTTLDRSAARAAEVTRHLLLALLGAPSSS
ncbi:MAG: TetR/AcrR family transcriptional regulator [Acidimicrobiales bacterium]|nr:TetR/AcrR family transcriptional regulator [Acidimicrobiales bacterium]